MRTCRTKVWKALLALLVVLGACADKSAGEATPADPGLDASPADTATDSTPKDTATDAEPKDTTTDSTSEDTATDAAAEDTPDGAGLDASDGGASTTEGPPNLILVVFDDLGVDAFKAFRDLEGWSEAPTPATPVLDGLMEHGVLFSRAWAHPTCSPTRLALHASLFAAQTGVLGPLGRDEEGLKAEHETLPERLGDSWRKGLFGKWHLGGNRKAPVEIGGWDVYSGRPEGRLESFFSWPRTYVESGGQPTVETVDTYATTVNVDDALRWLAEGDPGKPFMLMLAFNTPHDPYHLPPAELRPSLPDEALDADGDGECDAPGPCFRAMVEAADSEIGRLLASLPELDGGRDTVVVVMGDNGTARSVIEAPFTKPHSKGTLYDGGVHVPILISGSDSFVPARGSSELLVHAVDLPVTLLTLAGAEPLAAGEGRDLIADLRGEGGEPREILYTDGGTGPAGEQVEAATARKGHSKVLIPDVSVPDDYECFNLGRDPGEDDDLSARTDAPAECGSLHEALLAERARLLAGTN